MILRMGLTVLIGGLATAALAQTGNGNSNDNSSVIDRSPSENVRSGNVAARSPGNAVIRPAIARHQALMNSRLRGGGDNQTGSGTSGTSGTSGSNASTGATTTGSNAVGDLLSSLTGGSLSGSSLGALSGLLSNPGVSSLLTNALGSMVGGGTSTPSTTPTPTVSNTAATPTGTTAGTSGTTPTPQQQSSLDRLIALRDSFASGGGTSSTAKKIQSADANAGRGAVGSGNKSSARSQTNSGTGDAQPRFRVRLFDSWLGTIFAAVTLGFSSRDFIDSIKDALRPVFGLPAPTPTPTPTTQPTTRPSTGA